MPFIPDQKQKPIRLKGKAMQELREKVWLRAGGLCEKCGAYAPLGTYDDSIFERGHLCHIKSRGAGGSDTPENTYWGCARCHIGVGGDHGPRWSK